MKKIILARKSPFAFDDGIVCFTGHIDILEADIQTGRFVFAPQTCLSIEDALILSRQGEAQALATLLNERKQYTSHEWFPLGLPTAGLEPSRSDFPPSGSAGGGAFLKGDIK